MSTQEIGEFHLLVTAVDGARLADGARQFAAAFSLEAEMATQILKSAPIVFASKLTKKEIKAITPILQDLSKSGIEFRVTARLTQRVPKVNWPVRPRFTAGGSASTAGLAFQWDNNAFVCPGCGESFLFRRLGKLPVAEGYVPEPAPAASAPASAPAPAASARPAARPEPEAAEPEPVEAEIEVQSSEELTLAEPEEAVPAEASEFGAELQPVEEISLDLGTPGDAPGEPMIDLNTSDEPVIEEVRLEEEPAPEMAAPSSPAPSSKSSPAAVAAPADGELYNVFLSKISDRSKQQKAVELIAKVKGCPVAEAQELSGRLVIPLAKNIGKNQAEEILDQFKKLKIFGRMTKAK